MGTADAATIRGAATVMLLRDRARLEVFVLRRTPHAIFGPGATVFPGGAVDLDDAHSAPRVVGLDDISASAEPGLYADGIARRVAAVRECFEEAGILLARDSTTRMHVAPPHEWRDALNAGHATMSQVLNAEDLVIDARDLRVFAHWLTPVGAPRRYDTWFFVARSPEAQDGAHDDAELVASEWVDPRAALERYARDEIDLILPTLRTIEALARFDSVQCLFDALDDGPRDDAGRHLVVAEASGERVVLAGEDAERATRWTIPLPDISVHDEQSIAAVGEGVSVNDDQPPVSRLTPGVPNALSPLVRRVVAPNPGLMTGPGTNTYLVGIDEVAVVDPGPADDGHIDAIVGASMRDRVRWVLLTHTHPDHWPAAERIREQTGAVIAGFGKAPKADAFDLKIDRVLVDGSTIEGTEFRLEALHTPGHAPNHLCFFLEEERLVFTGDHVLNGTTTVVNPKRGGDMIQYLASLERLRKMKRLARLAPGHGEVIEDPKAWLDEYVAHRKMRERQIVKLLQDGPAKIPDIVAVLYVETPTGLIEMARRQVHAHLLKLKTEGKVQGSSVNAAWSLAK